MNVFSEPEQRSDSTDVLRSDGTESAVTETPMFRLGRILFGGILAFNALDNLRNLQGRVDYADAKDTPLARVSVPAISGSLLLGGLSVALWRAPVAGATAVASFLIGVTPMMHDFWNAEDEEQQQQELIHFLKNTALLGGALAFLEIAQREE
ncbi:DoxX family protein [Haloterrigena alkaliphila]|uniref:DoxX family protein n=1 Tax=Haloterrigena alkaliphila TaxID=2816475 RepID=A0A8A2VG21_9EURY|nr:DoxX family protein [Haloterrigena alkaliphila]QSW99315.1 DoxX family protein [Haloterrigena alkaliphila]